MQFFQIIRQKTTHSIPIERESTKICSGWMALFFMILLIQHSIIIIVIASVYYLNWHLQKIWTQIALKWAEWSVRKKLRLHSSRIWLFRTLSSLLISVCNTELHGIRTLNAKQFEIAVKIAWAQDELYPWAFSDRPLEMCAGVSLVFIKQKVVVKHVSLWYCVLCAMVWKCKCLLTLHCIYMYPVLRLIHRIDFFFVAPTNLSYVFPTGNILIARRSLTNSHQSMYNQHIWAFRT